MVSIPFKREGTFRLMMGKRRNTRHEQFRFPSNGKAHSDDPIQRKVMGGDDFSFDSLQTGRHIQTCVTEVKKIRDSYVFRFPSNGKAHSDLDIGKPMYVIAQLFVSIPFKREGTFRHSISDIDFQLNQHVSIPFKREGTFRRYRGIICFYTNSFDSLQTGRHIQTDPILSPVGPWLQKPKTKRELRRAIFLSNFSPKIPRTRVAIDPNAIF